MKKIGISLTGELRNYKDFIYSIVDFCKKYNIDIFLLINENENMTDIKNIESITNPKNIEFTDSLEASGNINMWYKIKKGYNQIKKYEIKNNIKYDLFIRCRYDIFIEDSNINFDNLENNVIYTGASPIHFLMKIRNKLFEYTNDELFIGDRKVMDIYCNLFDQIIKSNNKNQEYTISENILYNFIHKIYFTKHKQLDIKYKFLHKNTKDLIKYLCTKKREIVIKTAKNELNKQKYYILLILIIILGSIYIYKYK